MLLQGVEDPQDMQEQVDDVQVQVYGGQDVLFRRQLLHQEAGVEDDEATENERSGSGQKQLRAVTVEEELRKITRRKL